MTDDADAPMRSRPGRPPKDQKRIPVSLRLSPTTARGLQAMAKDQGRTVTGQTEFLLEHAARELGWKLYDLSPAPIEDLYDRLARLEAELDRLRTTTEKGLANNDTAVTRAYSALYRLQNDVAGKNADMTTASRHLETVTT